MIDFVATIAGKLIYKLMIKIYDQYWVLNFELTS